MTRGGPGVLGNPSKGNLWYYANTDNRKALSFFYNGNHWADTMQQLAPRHQPGRELARDLVDVAQPRLPLQHQPRRLAVGGERGRSTTADSATCSAASIRRRVAFTTRFNYTMTPNLSLQVYAEPFVSAGEYSNYKELVDGRAEKYEDRYRPYAYAGSADFNIRSFRTTNVLRWEYRPGSQLFLVWQQGKSDDQELRRFPLRPRLRRRVLRAVAQRLPDQVQLLAEYVGEVGR